MKGVKILLTVVILALIGWLFKIIYDPIKFEDERDRRYAKVIERLKDIRTAQNAYKMVYNRYTASFDTLLNFINNDNFAVVKRIGNEDDSTAVIVRDTIMIAVIDSLFKPGYPVDSLPFVPFGEGAKFKLSAGEIERGNVKIKVFEAVDTNPFDKNKVLKVGSMTEPSNAGNWE